MKRTRFMKVISLLERIGILIAKARSCGAPVVYIQHNEGPGEPLETNSLGWNIHSTIAPTDGDVVIQKRTPDSFHETNLQDELNKLGVTQTHTDRITDRDVCRHNLSPSLQFGI